MELNFVFSKCLCACGLLALKESSVSALKFKQDNSK